MHNVIVLKIWKPQCCVSYEVTRSSNTIAVQLQMIHYKFWIKILSKDALSFQRRDWLKKDALSFQRRDLLEKDALSFQRRDWLQKNALSFQRRDWL